MNNYTLRINDSEKLKFKTPTGRHEVNYSQWNEAYKYLNFKDDNSEDLGLEKLCRIIAALSQDVTFDDLRKLDIIVIQKLYLSDFSDWLQNETPKRNFVVNGKKISIPKFNIKKAGDFMDAMALLDIIKDKHNDSEVGLTIAAVYFKDDINYNQDIEAIDRRKAELKKYAKMDLFYSAGFFLGSFLMDLKKHIPQPTQLIKVAEKLTHNLKDLDIMHSLLRLQKANY